MSCNHLEQNVKPQEISSNTVNSAENHEYLYQLEFQLQATETDSDKKKRSLEKNISNSQ